MTVRFIHSVIVMLFISICTVLIVFTLYVLSISDIEYSESVGNPPSFQLNYTTIKHLQSYTVKAKLMIGGIITNEKGVEVYTLLDSHSTIHEPTTCPSSTSRRRKKRMIDINQ